jgi:preprotein translocase subunit SecG
MQFWSNLLFILQILSAMAMIGLVLIQHGKGADMGASFGSGASGSLFGATGSANFLSRSTAVCAFVFFVCTLYLAYSANDRPRISTGGSILDRPAASASAARPASSGVFTLPGATSSGAAATTGPASGAAALPLAVPKVAPSTPIAASGAGAIPQK